MEETLNAPDPERVRVLEAARDAAYHAFKDAEDTLRNAERALLLEQCRDLPRYAVGDVILIPKVYFGKTKMVEAKVIRVNFYHNGPRHDGLPESKFVSYSVYLRQKDGGFGGSSESFEHHEVLSFPGETS